MYSSTDATGEPHTPADPVLLHQIESEAAQANANDRADDPEDPATGGINPRTVQARLRHAEAATTTAIGPGFEFTAGEVELQLKHCRDQLADLRVNLLHADEAVTAVYPPAPDPASTAQADAVRNMPQNTVHAISADINYLANWQNQLSAVKQRYMITEHLNEQQWIRLSRGLPT
jgi:hypothetical protein